MFEVERQKLAGFPPQPERFVGRVGPLTRAATVLAPDSGGRGWCSMAWRGRGRPPARWSWPTPIRSRFRGLVWYAAPAEGDDITTALTDFALALEQQLPGSRLFTRSPMRAVLRQVLPRLTELLEQQRVLIVFDNIESLLTETGDGGMTVGGLLVDALTAHRGLSRLVLTSRRPPGGLDGGCAGGAGACVVVGGVGVVGAGVAAPEPTAGRHGSAGRCDRGAGTGVGGADVGGGAGASEADRVGRRARRPTRPHWRPGWTRPTHLGRPGHPAGHFLASGEADATDEDYRRCCRAGPATATALLDEPTPTFFRFLACVEDEDRIRPVVDGNWADLWRRLDRPGDPPDPAALAAAGRAGAGRRRPATPTPVQPVGTGFIPGWPRPPATRADPDLRGGRHRARRLLDGQPGSRAKEPRREELGWLVLRAARSAAPYLLRQHRWDDLDTACERLLARDPSTATAAALLPMLAAALQPPPTPTSPSDLGRIHALALERFDPDRAETRYRELLDTAVARELRPRHGPRRRPDQPLPGPGPVRRGAHPGRRQDRLHPPRRIRPLDPARRPGHAAADPVSSGAPPRRSSTPGRKLRDQMARLPDPPDPNDAASTPGTSAKACSTPWSSPPATSAEYEQALDLNSEILASEAPPRRLRRSSRPAPRSTTTGR